MYNGYSFSPARLVLKILFLSVFTTLIAMFVSTRHPNFEIKTLGLWCDTFSLRVRLSVLIHCNHVCNLEFSWLLNEIKENKS